MRFFNRREDESIIVSVDHSPDKNRETTHEIRPGRSKIFRIMEWGEIHGWAPGEPIRFFVGKFLRYIRWRGDQITFDTKSRSEKGVKSFSRHGITAKPFDYRPRSDRKRKP